jgi:hypothetical protein
LRGNVGSERRNLGAAAHDGANGQGQFFLLAARTSEGNPRLPFLILKARP